MHDSSLPPPTSHLPPAPQAPIARYHGIGLAGWSCLTVAGDAAASASAVTGGSCALVDDPAIGWSGRLARPGERDPLARLVPPAARQAWAPLAAGGGPVALGIGTSKGDPWAWGDVRRFAGSWPGMEGPRIARDLGLGTWIPCATAAACSTGLTCVLAAADLLQAGLADRALAGAAESSFTPLVLAGFSRLGVLCGHRRPSALRGEGTGFAPAEGVGLFALHRGPAPWRLVAGVRLGDAGHETHFVDPATLAATLAGLWSALPHPDLIVAHATGTAAGDAYELAGLDHGPWRHVPRLAAKPVIGHCLGASGAVELALACELPARRIWKLSLGFGGHLAGIALERA